MMVRDPTAGAGQICQPRHKMRLDAVRQNDVRLTCRNDAPEPGYAIRAIPPGLLDDIDWNPSLEKCI
jgi:hypothetical protein